jgi:hypothetical protein
MVHYAGTLTNEGLINYYRPVYSKYDEVGSIIVDEDNEELKPNEVMLPLEFPELLNIDDYKVIAGVLCDLDGNPIQPFSTLPEYREIKDKGYATKYEWLYYAHSKLFHSSGYKIWSNPTLYYYDVVDEFERFTSSDVIGETLYVTPAETNLPVLIEGHQNIEELFNKFKEMEGIEKPLHSTIREYANNPSEELEVMIDELIDAVRIYM